MVSVGNVSPGLLDQHLQAGEHDDVGQRHAHREQHGRDRDEGDRVLAFLLLESGRDERPQLVEPERGGADDADQGADLQPHDEAGGDPEVGQLAIAAGLGAALLGGDVAVGRLEEAQDRVVEEVGNCGPDADDDQRQDDPAAQLAQVVDDRHPSFRVGRRTTAGEAGHGSAATGGARRGTFYDELQPALHRGHLGRQGGQPGQVAAQTAHPPQHLVGAEPEQRPGRSPRPLRPPTTRSRRELYCQRPATALRGAARPRPEQRPVGEVVQPAYAASAARADARMSSASHGGESTVTSPEELRTSARTQAGSDTRRLI